MSKSSVIKIEDLYKYYLEGSEKHYVLKKIFLDIYQGEYASIIGSSGSGKSTLLNILGCLDLEYQGKYHLNGIQTTGLSDEDISKTRNQHIGFVFQSFNLIPQLTLVENVEVPLYYLGIPKQERLERSMKYLKLTKIDHRYNYFPNQISGGERQRCAIARALVSRPSLILADEPTGNLDSKTGKTIMNLFDRLYEKGKTIIIVTHDLSIAERTPRTIKIKDGQILN